MAHLACAGQVQQPQSRERFVELGRYADLDESPAAFTCTTWFEYNGDRYGEQTFTVEPAVCGFDAFLQSLRAAQTAHPGFRVDLRR